jgi:hypothetical protein
MKKATTEVGNRRLLKLAEFLRTVPRKKFDYRSWVGADWEGKQDLSCGTTACALGWAATMPSFRRLGMRLKTIESSMATTTYHGYVGLKDSNTTDSLWVAEQVFGLSYEDASRLFTPSEDEEEATPKQVAKKIEQFVAKRAE